MSNPWTEDLAETAAKLWREGASAGETAKRLGLTRNQVIGKLHRLGLTRVAKDDTSAIAAKRARANAEQKRRSRAKQSGGSLEAAPPQAPCWAPSRAPLVFGASSPIPKPPTPLKQDSAPGPHSRTLLLIGRCRCMYPVGTATGADQLFCGEPAEPGRSYCAGHARVCGGGHGGRVRA